MKKFAGKTVLVTGSSRGIGKAIALAFSKKDANVVISCKKNWELLDDVRSEIKTNVLAFLMDVTNFKEVDDAVEMILKRFNNIDILINNAGNFENSFTKTMSSLQWQNVIDVNLTGVFNCTKAVLNKANPSRIINISSVVAQTGSPGAANYAAAKAGVLGFTKAVARELALKGTTVNTVASGYINTGMWTRLSKKIQEKVFKQIPMNRPGKIEEIVEPILFLASEGAGYITGQTINVNGGIYM